MSAATSVRLYTLVLVRKMGQVLLGLKKRGLGVGKWNGFGGKVEPGETIEQAAARELFEESGLTSCSLDKLAVIRFQFVNNPVAMEVHVFTTCRFSGEARETEEMIPCWFAIDEVPFPQMWPDDRLWWPLFVKKQKFNASFLYDEKVEVVLESNVTVDVDQS